jgi:hypothetical protein
MTVEEAAAQVEDWQALFTVAHATVASLRRATVRQDRLAFWDAMIWSVVREAGVPLLLSEDFEHERVDAEPLSMEALVLLEELRLAPITSLRINGSSSSKAKSQGSQHRGPANKSKPFVFRHAYGSSICARSARIIRSCRQALITATILARIPAPRQPATAKGRLRGD